ncbi:DNA cytosine methyltransferase [Ancylobacter oerskovii]|uniref:DNA cytosine methyltransferase n=1 Tax=Ancylobacter oerskovii TaxID=459519 RepID=A0ABW4Z2C0_9HYPH|nr:DNA cytosine methyltransferase [Ancylobacter oerskovii]MBS7545075.1 DNA cytosine methyltransferase [Ancylobacter oerskovii]
MAEARAYFNEIDPYAAQWLRNLIAEGLIAPGDVDERSIVDVRPDDLAGYTQCHFFAGIGGWSYALRLAGWPDLRPVWTASCPCQPLSSAGQRKGHADRRHLWPSFYELYAECRPPVAFGEQVASSDGREWLAGIRADLEDLGDACGAIDICAASVGAPHGRPRIYWVANTNRRGKRRQHPAQGGAESESQGEVGGAFWERFRVVTGRGIGWDRGERRRCAPGSGALVLAHGFPGRVAQVRAFGNAIVPQVAAEVIRAFLDIERSAA